MSSQSRSRQRGIAYEVGRASGLLSAALPLVRNQRARAYVESALQILIHVVEREEPAPKRAPRLTSARPPTQTSVSD